MLTGISFLSFISTAFLWGFITCKIVSYHIYAFRQRKQNGTRGKDQQHQFLDTPDLTLGIGFETYRGGQPTTVAVLDDLAKLKEEKPANEHGKGIGGGFPAALDKLSERMNPLPVLVYNLLFSDMLEALAYAMSISWVIQDGIFAPSSTCWAQGWLGSISNLAASLFLSAISASTFLTIVLGCSMSRWILYTVISGIWLFTLSINAAGVLQSQHGNMRTGPGDSYFMRANVWVSSQTETSPLNMWMISLLYSAGFLRGITTGDSGRTTFGSSLPPFSPSLCIA